MDGATLHEPSGKLGRGPFVAPLVVIPATLAIALAYGYADVYCPIAGFVSLLLVGAYVFAIGLVVGVVRSFGKVRSAGFMTSLGLAAGLFALYTAWVAFEVALIGKSSEPGEQTPGYLDLFLRPDLVWKFASMINQTGWYSIKSATPSGGVLWGMWGVEAALIVGGTTLMARASLSDEVFCEECNVWCEDDARKPLLAVPADLAALQPAIDGDPGGAAALERLDGAVEGSPTFLSLDLKRCPECKQHATSILRLVTITVDKEGKTSTQKADLSPRYVVDPATYERLAALHGKPPAPPAPEPAPPA